MTAVSIRQVAARAGVSAGTVSKVLNGSLTAQIAPETQERVRRAAAELNYHPSAVARALLRKRLDTIGVILPQGVVSPLSVSLYVALFDQLLEVASDKGQNVTVFTGSRWVSAAESLSRFRDGRVDGFLVFFQPDTSDLLPTFRDRHIPFVVINDTTTDPAISSVDIDNYQAGHVMAEHLIGLGHQRIAYFTSYRNEHWVAPRLNGGLDAMRHAGIPTKYALILEEGNQANNPRDLTDYLLALPKAERPTAIICSNDLLALGVMQQLELRGVAVPDDISIGAFDDIPEAARQRPPLTTVRQPLRAIAQQAIMMLLEQIQDTGCRGEKSQLLGELIIRSSTGKPSAP